MDWKLVGTTFVAVFVAELGDKTQLAALSLSASSHKPWAVFLGAAGALVLVTAIGVGFGEALARMVSPRALRIAGGVLFVGVGIWMLVSARR